MELRAEWFDPDSIETTLKNLLDTFDQNYLKTVSKPALEKDLTKEVLFLSAYDRNREKEIATYIHNHIELFYTYAKKISHAKLLHTGKKSR